MSPEADAGIRPAPCYRDRLSEVMDWNGKFELGFVDAV